METANCLLIPTAIPEGVMGTGDFFLLQRLSGGVIRTRNCLLTSPFWTFLIRPFDFLVRGW